MTQSSEGGLEPQALLGADFEPDVVAVVARHLERREVGSRPGEAEYLTTLVTPDGVAHVKSTKLSNCRLNWKSLVLDLLPALVGKAADPLSAALLALRIARTLSAAATVQLGDLEGKVVLELWRDPADRTPLTDDELGARLKVPVEALERTIMRLQSLGVLGRSERDGRLIRVETMIF